MNEYIYGRWRGTPAREHIKTGARSRWVEDERTDGFWSELAFGYRDEFIAWPEELARLNQGDAWSNAHRS